jgi:DNA-binding MarR family transcriptional regulator
MKRRTRSNMDEPTRTEAADEPATLSRSKLDLGPLPNLLGYALRRAQVAVFADFIASFAALELRPAQFSALLLIRHNPGCKQSDVAEALGILRPNFVAMMDELDHRGLTQRTTSKDDRRSYAIYLTEAGESLLSQAMLVVAAHEGRLTSALQPGEQEQLLDILTRIEGAISSR